MVSLRLVAVDVALADDDPTTEVLDSLVLFLDSLSLFFSGSFASSETEASVLEDSLDVDVDVDSFVSLDGSICSVSSSVSSSSSSASSSRAAHDANGSLGCR